MAGRPDPQHRQPAARGGAESEVLRRHARPARAVRLLAAVAEAAQRADRRDRPGARRVGGRRAGAARAGRRARRRRRARRPRRRRAASPAPAGHARRRGAADRDAGGRRLRRAAHLPAVAALPALRVRPARVLADRAPGRGPADGPRPVPVLRGRHLRVLPRPAGGGRLPPELQRRQLRRAVAGTRLLQVLGHGPRGHGRDVPAAAGDPRGRPHGDHDPAPAAQEPALRDPHHRRDRGAAPRRRPRDDAADHVPDPRAVRGFYPSRRAARPPRPRRAAEREAEEAADADAELAPYDSDD